MTSMKIEERRDVQNSNPENMTNSGKAGLNNQNICKPLMGWDNVSRGVNFPVDMSHPSQMFYENHSNSVIRSGYVKRSTSVIGHELARGPIYGVNLYEWAKEYNSTVRRG